MMMLLQDETTPQVYVAVEWLQDADAAGEEAKELETPSKPTVCLPCTIFYPHRNWRRVNFVWMRPHS